ncbi:major capsid protein [Lactobacillus crispatus]|uniref:major capsid protein n=1 Tax=Lactobacillus crispatus TaxID=47770 RepID=UPI0029C46B95|nr:major capsid protein [Lactobacillus crispatus]MDX5091606.1 major capsid protein [Lactobacillus crispatus]
MKIKQSALAGRFMSPQNAIATTGGSISIYEPQTMLPAFQRRMPVTTFLRDMFFAGETTFDTKHVIMDFYKNRQRVAPLVAEGSLPINIKRDGFETKIYTAPFINLASPIDTGMLQSRLPGEAVFGGMSPDERAVQQMNRDFLELSDMITRREELMDAELLQTGKVTVSGYIDDAATIVRTDTIDFGFENTINLTGGSQWNQTTSKKYEDLEEAVRKSRKAGYNPTIALLGEQAWADLRADDNFMTKFMDLRYAQFGTINPQLNIESGNGYTYIGRLTELGLDLYRYDAWYFDETTQTLKPYIDPEKIIVAPRNIGEMLYGANTFIPEDSINYVTVEATRATKVTVNRDTDVKSLIVKSRPLPKPFDVSAWSVIKTRV